MASEPTTNRSPEEQAGQEDSAHRLWNIPNQLTAARIVLSVIFFVVLAMLTHGVFPASATQTVLNCAIALFILAVVTDFLDGYLARKWGLLSTFGRIADPFADKIVICGGFVMLTGVAQNLVAPWFAVIIMFREFLVSGLRSFLESRGVPFGAATLGKLKMVLQSVAIPMVLFYVANLAPFASDEGYRQLARVFYWLTVFCLSVTLILTVASCVDYLRRAAKILTER